MAPVLDVLRFLVGGSLLVYAATTDLRTRRVPNRTWIVGSAAGVALILMEFLMRTGRFGWVELVTIPIVCAVAYALWYLHLIAGGADAKAIMTLAVLLPLPIDIPLLGYGWPLWDSIMPTSIVVFANALLAFVIVPFALALANLVRGSLHVPGMFLGYQISIEDAQRRHVWPMERVNPAGRPRLLLFGSRLSKEELDGTFDALRAAGRERVWVTPKVPFMVPLLAGFVAAFTLGDVFTAVLVEPLVQALQR